MIFSHSGAPHHEELSITLQLGMLLEIQSAVNCEKNELIFSAK
jgi:hypothetical protein